MPESSRRRDQGSGLIFGPATERSLEPFPIGYLDDTGGSAHEHLVQDAAMTGSDWLSIDEPAAPDCGWYAVLRLHPDFQGRLVCGAAYCGDDRWGRNHDIFARSPQRFADAAAAEAFAVTSSAFLKPAGSP